MPTLTAESEHRPFFRSVLEAIRGTEQDFTEGSISRAVLLLATPMVLEMFMESLFAVVDIFWVTQLGPNAVAAIGLTESLQALVFAVAMGLTMATTAMVARRIGEKNSRGAAVAAGQAILLGIIVAVVMGLPAAWFAPRLLELMGAAPALVANGRSYTTIIMGSSVTVMLLFLNNAIFRGAGDPAVAFRVLAVSNAINLVLDPCLIFGWGPFPKMGLTGAAVATAVGRSIGVLFQFWILFGGSSRISIRLGDLRPEWRVMASLVRVSSTGVLQFAVGHTSWVALVRIISAFGGFAVAGYTIGIRIFAFAILPAWGLSGAAATMVGQNLGAGRPERAARAVWLTGFYNMLYMVSVAAVFIAFPESIIGLFTHDPAVVPYAVNCLRIVSYGNLSYAFGMVMVQAFNGAGDTVTPSIINIIGFWMCQIPLAWFLAMPAGFGVNGVFAAIPLAESFITVMGLAVFCRGKWKTRKI
ncbi:MAG TPA: MATE family efflux transporter [Bryobacteraceae bacterium]|nr:MATE family efflux transporter [Bryobacteraceae bacterium]